MSSRLQRWLNRVLDLSLRALLGYVLLVIAKLCVIGLACLSWYQIRQPRIEVLDFHRACWFAASDGLFWAIVAMAAMTLLNPGHLLLKRRNDKPSWDKQSNYFVHGLREIRTKVLASAPPHQLNRAYELLLRAAAIELQRHLSLLDDTSLKTNLVLVRSAGKIEVVARSRPGSPIGIHYTHKPSGLAASRAMMENKTVVATKIRDLPGHEHKPYNTVVATPICDGVQAFGAMTADSAESGAFAGREEAIDRILRPYAAIILLTLPESARWVHCKDRWK